MHTVARSVGRLIEIRVASPVTVSEVVAFAKELQGIVDGMNQRFVACSDFSRVSILPPEAVATYATCMRSLNVKLERTGLLVSTSATLSLQIARLLRDGANPKRKVFRDPSELKLWLGTALTADEQARLAKFLASE